MVEQTFELDYHRDTDLEVQNKAPKFEMSLEVNIKFTHNSIVT